MVEAQEVLKEHRNERLTSASQSHPKATLTESRVSETEALDSVLCVGEISKAAPV